MKNYYSIEGKLYVITNKIKKQLDKLYPKAKDEVDTNHADRLTEIRRKGKRIKCEYLYYSNSAY